MGICLRNKEFEMDMGYGSFFNLRCTIANLLNKDFGNNYHNLSRCIKKEDFEKNDEIANHFIEYYSLDTDIVDFLYAPDSEGKIDYKVCKKIYDIIKDYNDDYMYGYVHANHTFEYFKNMIHDCATRRRTLYWS